MDILIGIEAIETVDGPLAYLLVFVFAAVPVVEVLVVIPFAIAVGLDPLLVGVAAAVGNLTTVCAVVVASDWSLRFVRRRYGDPTDDTGDDSSRTEVDTPSDSDPTIDEEPTTDDSSDDEPDLFERIFEDDEPDTGGDESIDEDDTGPPADAGPPEDAGPPDDAGPADGNGPFDDDDTGPFNDDDGPFDDEDEPFDDDPFDG